MYLIKQPSGRLDSNRNRKASTDCLDGQLRHIECTLGHFNCCVPVRAFNRARHVNRIHRCFLQSLFAPSVTLIDGE